MPVAEFKPVGIIDYGIGNLFNVKRAVRHVGASPHFVRTGMDLLSAPALILPGVGAFPDGVKGLRDAGLWEPLVEYAKSGRPLLGICLGMQLLFESSSEFGMHGGLGIIPGHVGPLENKQHELNLKIPHIGWAEITPPADREVSWQDTILRDVKPTDSVYFVHSYAAIPAVPTMVLANGAYGPTLFCAAVRSKNVTGCQFHPERSGEVGLSILRNFFANE